MIDFRWMEFGGIYLDPSGDIAVTSAATMDSIQDTVQSRLKAATNGWKLYPIGADLEARIGDVTDPEFTLSLQRQVTDALSNGFLPTNSFQVKVLTYRTRVEVLVYVQNTLLANVTLNTSNPSQTVQ
jgi:hypothetical protein